MRIVYFGTPEIAVAPLEQLHAAGREVVGVVTQPDRPAGRRSQLTPPPVKVAAERLGIPVFQPETLKDAAAVERLREWNFDVGIVAAYGEILRRDVLALPRAGYLNIHPSVLPLYRGPAPVAGAILAGDDVIGVSIIRLTAKMDAGPIVAQITQPLPRTARAGTLTAELMAQGGAMINEILDAYVDAKLQPHLQDDRDATYTSLLTKADGVIDWSLPALVIERMTRAYDPWPGAITTVNGQSLRILSARVDGTRHASDSPGTLLPDGFVATGSGLLELLEVQPAGKKPMLAADWVRGLRNVNRLGDGMEA